MRANRPFLVVMLFAVVMMRPSLVSAQTSSIDLPIEIGQKVTITTADRTVTHGTVRTLTPASVVLATGSGDVSLAVMDVTRIRVPDSVGDGAVEGAVSLALPLTLIVALSCEIRTWDDNQCRRHGNVGWAGPAAKTALVTGGVGALIGILMDASKEKTTYKSEARSKTVSFRPLVSAAGKGIGGRVTW